MASRIHFDIAADAGPPLALRWLYDGEVPPEYCAGRLATVGIACWHVRSGRVEVRTGGGTVSAGPGEWLFPARTGGWQNIESGTRLLSLRIELGAAESTWPLPREASLVLSRDRGRELRKLGEELLRRCAAAARHPRDPRATWARQVALARWVLAAIARLESVVPTKDSLPADARVEAVLTRVQQPGGAFSASEVARAVSLSVSQMNRLVVRATGRTPRHLWEEARHQRVIEALRDPARSIKRVAFDEGFASLPRFSHWVRRRTGLSPRQWRQSFGGI